MISVLIESLLHVTYQDDLAKKTETLRSIMHLDIEQTTLALLLHVMPKYLQYKQHRQHLTDPQGSALAKLLVSLLFLSFLFTFFLWLFTNFCFNFAGGMHVHCFEFEFKQKKNSCGGFW